MSFANTSARELYGQRVSRTLLVADMVESVLLFERDEAGILARWLEICDYIESNIVPAFNGRFVKNLGDGVLLEFQQAPSAVAAAFAIQQACRRNNVYQPADSHIMLRIGIEIGDVLIVQHDVFGHGVNLAARLSTLAGPGETVVSVRVREQLTPMLDADIEDLGECYLKHIRNPVRAYRIGPPGPRSVLEGRFALGDLRPSIAVVPFATPNLEPDHQLIGDVLAEEIIRALSCSPDLDVISRLSTGPFRDRGILVTEINAHLDVEFVLSGSYVIEGTTIKLHIELTEAKSARIIWTDRVEDRLMDLIRGEREMIARIVAAMRVAMVVHEVERARSQALPTSPVWPQPEEACHRKASTTRWLLHRECAPSLISRQHFGGCGLPPQRLVTLGFALSKLSLTLGKLTLQIGYELLGIGQRAVGRRTHLRTSSGQTFGADHTVNYTDHHSCRPGRLAQLRRMTGRLHQFRSSGERL